LLGNKIDEVQREFNDRSPSASIKVPALLGPEAKLSLDYVQSAAGGKQQPGTQPGQPKSQPGQPANTVYMQKPDGNYIFVPLDKQKQAEAAGAKVIQ
jgi:hypothetical protein